VLKKNNVLNYIVIDDESYGKFVEAGIRYVSYRPRSEKEMRTYLLEKASKRKIEKPAELIDKVIDRLRELTYVNDETFVDWWIDQRTSHRPKGSRFIARELQQKGVQRELYEEKLATGNELEKAHSVLSRKASQLQNLPLLERKKKIYSLLGTRGFSGETISRIIDEKA
jgi:regulatory protein